jgi:hypothetical protein
LRGLRPWAILSPLGAVSVLIILFVVAVRFALCEAKSTVLTFRNSFCLMIVLNVDARGAYSLSGERTLL